MATKPVRGGSLTLDERSAQAVPCLIIVFASSCFQEATPLLEGPPLRSQNLTMQTAQNHARRPQKQHRRLSLDSNS